jgi:hypothetical protein
VRQVLCTALPFLSSMDLVLSDDGSWSPLGTLKR